MICDTITPVSMAAARTMGRQACLAANPQATVTTSTMMGKATGPKITARKIITPVSVSERMPSSQSRIGSSGPHGAVPLCTTPTRVAMNTRAPTPIRITAQR